jgi:hypothetical protein
MAGRDGSWAGVDQSVGVVVDAGVRLGGPGGGRGLDGGGGRDGRAEQVPGQVRDAPEVEGVEDLEGEYDLVELDLAVGALEDAGAARDGQVRLLVGQVRALHRDVAVVAEVEAVDGLVPVAVAVGDVLDEHADAGGDAQPLVQAAVVNLGAWVGGEEERLSGGTDQAKAKAKAKAKQGTQRRRTLFVKGTRSPSAFSVCLALRRRYAGLSRSRSFISYTYSSCTLVGRASLAAAGLGENSDARTATGPPRLRGCCRNPPTATLDAWRTLEAAAGLETLAEAGDLSAAAMETKQRWLAGLALDAMRWGREWGIRE